MRHLAPLLLLVAGLAAAPDTSGRHSGTVRHAVFYACQTGAVGQRVLVGMVDLSRGKFRWKQTVEGLYGGVGWSADQVWVILRSPANEFETVHFDLSTGEELFRCEGRTQSVRIGGRKVLFLKGKDFFARLDPKTGRTVWSRAGQTDYRTFPLGENRLAVGFSNSELVCLNVRDGREIWTRDGQERLVTSEDSHWLYRSGHTTVSLLDPETGRSREEHESKAPVSWASGSLGGLVVTERNRAVFLGNESGRAKWSTDLDCSRLNYSFGGRSGVLVMGNGYQKMWILDPDSGRVLREVDFSGDYQNGWDYFGQDLFILGLRSRTGDGCRVMAFDLKKGTLAWERDGEDVQTSDDPPAVLIRNGGKLQRVDPRTGEAAWSRDFSGGLQRTAIIGRQALGTSGDTLTSVDLATGRERWRLILDFTPNYFHVTDPRR